MDLYRERNPPDFEFCMFCGIIFSIPINSDLKFFILVSTEKINIHMHNKWHVPLNLLNLRVSLVFKSKVKLLWNFFKSDKSELKKGKRRLKNGQKSSNWINCVLRVCNGQRFLCEILRWWENLWIIRTRLNLHFSFRWQWLYHWRKCRPANASLENGFWKYHSIKNT